MDSTETQRIHLSVNTVIGTGDPFDRIALIPLISDWRVPRQCVWSLREECEGALTRLYVLQEPVQGHKVVGACEKHHKMLGGEEETQHND